MKNLIKKAVYIVIFTTIISVGIAFVTPAKAAISNSGLVSLVNSSREQAGLGDLATNSQLAEAAQSKADDMLANQYFAHTSPEGKTPWDFIKASGYPYVYAGENLAIGYTDTADLFNAWMNSSSHRENILSPNFRDIGVAQASGLYDGTETTVTVQMFGSTTSDQAAATSNASAEVKSEASSNPPATSDNSQNQDTHQKAFDLVMEQTGFSPKAIFTGESVDFKVTLTGNISEIYITLGKQKIDLTEAGKTEQDGNKTIFEKQEAINQIGVFPVTLTVSDKWGNREVKDLGKVNVSQKVIAKTNDSSPTLISGFRSAISQNWGFYAGGVMVVIVLAVGLVVFRKIRFGKKLSISLANWEF